MSTDSDQLGGEDGRRGIEELRNGEVVQIDGKTGPVYATRAGEDAYDVEYAGFGLREREERHAVRTLMDARQWRTVPIDESPFAGSGEGSA